MRYEVRSFIPHPSSLITHPSYLPASVLYDVRHRAVVLVELDAAEDAGEGDAVFDDLFGDGYHDLHRLAIGVLDGDRHRDVEHFADLFDPHHQRVALDARGEFELRQRGRVDPPLEETLERLARFRFHRGAQVFGAGLLEARRPIEAPDAAEEVVVSHEAAQHVEHGGALVVDERAKNLALAADVSEPVTEIDRPLPRLLHSPAP